jgi:5'-3' exonuclease
MKQQIGRLIEYLEQLPVTLLCIDGIEADDTIAYISQQVLDTSDILIMSSDKDFLQLVNNRVKVWSPTKKKLYNTNEVFEEYGIPSKNILTYRILDGDKSDNINGIKGAGIKSIIKHIPQITTDQLFDVIDLMDFAKTSDSKIKLLENIKNSSNLLKRNYLLMQLSQVDIPNHTKMKIQGAVNGEVPQLIKYKFQTMFLKDKLSTQIKDLDSWIMEFVRLDRFRGLSDK